MRIVDRWVARDACLRFFPRTVFVGQRLNHILDPLPGIVQIGMRVMFVVIVGMWFVMPKSERHEERQIESGNGQFMTGLGGMQVEFPFDVRELGLEGLLLSF